MQVPQSKAEPDINPYAMQCFDRTCRVMGRILEYTFSSKLS